jgi:DNA-directed RNA polymerase specialized sigma24 family protein
MFEDFPKKITGWIGRRDDDLSQEGLIAAWQAYEKNPGQSENYYWAVAKNRVRQIMRGDPMVGSTRERGHWPTTDIAVSDLAPYAGMVEHDLDTKIDLEGALDKLTDEEYLYVVLRFYHGYGAGEAARKAGLSLYAWKDRIRPKLERVLS